MDEVADDGLLPDDLSVVFGVAGAGRGVPQFGEIAVAAGVLDEVLLVEVVGEGHEIDGLALFDMQAGGSFENPLMAEDVEIFGPQMLDDVEDGAIIADHAPQDAA